MGTSLDSKIAERKRRWCDFFDWTKPPQHMFMLCYSEGVPGAPPAYPENKQQRIDWAWTAYEYQLKRAEWLEDDTIPYMNVYTGTEIFAEAFGCKVHRPPDTNPCAVPMIRSASEVSKVKVPDLGASSLAMYFEMADELKRRGGKASTLRMIDIQSPMDIAALIWDKNEFYVAITESPDAVKELAAKVTELMAAFMDEWFARYGQDYAAHYPDYYMPKGITLSEDEVGSVSREMFEEFFLPELKWLSERYGGIGIHCCANARHQWHNFLKVPGLRLINIHQPPEQVRDAYKFFTGHTTHMHSWCGDGELETWTYPDGARVVLQLSADKKDKALDLSQRARKFCGRE